MSVFVNLDFLVSIPLVVIVRVENVIFTRQYRELEAPGDVQGVWQAHPSS